MSKVIRSLPLSAQTGNQWCSEKTTQEQDHFAAKTHGITASLVLICRLILSLIFPRNSQIQIVGPELSGSVLRPRLQSFPLTLFLAAASIITLSSGKSRNGNPYRLSKIRSC